MYVLLAGLMTCQFPVFVYPPCLRFLFVYSSPFSPTPSVATVTDVSDGQEETPSQQQARISASSATRELDELMASLSDFKVQSNVSQIDGEPIQRG